MDQKSQQQHAFNLADKINALMECGIIAEFARKGYLRAGRCAVVVDLHLCFVGCCDRAGVKKTLDEPLCMSALSLIDSYNPLTHAVVIGLVRYERAADQQETQYLITLCSLADA